MYFSIVFHKAWAVQGFLKWPEQSIGKVMCLYVCMKVKQILVMNQGGIHVCNTEDLQHKNRLRILDVQFT